MKQAGLMQILDHDTYFSHFFEQSGDKFENEHLDLALQYVSHKRVALDIGAHYGSWTRQLSREFGHVYAFELRPEIYECLEKNISSIPSYKNNVSVVNCAVGEKTGFVACKNGEDHFDNCGCNAIDPDDETGSIRMVALDDCSLDKIDFIKIDVEGYELRVLEGAKDTLLRCKPVVLLEDNGRSLDFGIPRGAVLDYAKSLGMQVSDILRGRDYILTWK